MVMESSKWWWIGNHNTTSFSPWLHSTLSELDEKTKEMLRVIDEDADTFAARAEMYYKKRPELVAMVEDFYRSHRSLAERHELLRPSSVHKHGSEKHREKSSTCDDESSWSEACETHEEYAESEVDDESSPVDYGEPDGSFEMVKEEIERLREENKVYSEMVRERDEEKREAIRQMSLAIDMLKEENSELKRCVSSVVSQRKVKLEGFWGRLVGNWILPKTDSTSRESS
ncbi:hypothetical protein F2Q70_00042167 [Brassica cretica]|uniref:NAB domain-containing protein n=1 Tax=Brassica cretica TaxID=69181 RepID=A0A8S9K968_BRACR|nr:hypothetical protein F2Q70_00042167 [Brassica cretica]KAF2621016.1 hypothetical protein F2Q68_00042832 [Brassica cretica]